jgi:hypothetical protein
MHKLGHNDNKLIKREKEITKRKSLHLLFITGPVL